MLRKSFRIKLVIATICLNLFAMSVFAQDDGATVGKVVDAVSRQQLGKAEIITDSSDFGFYVKMWLNGSKLRIIRPTSGSRSATLNCSFREYKVSASNPKDSGSWEETGSGTATLQTPVDANGEVRKMTGSMVVTERIVGDKETKVTEKAQRFEIIIE